jgi:hypothetical protein
MTESFLYDNFYFQELVLLELLLSFLSLPPDLSSLVYPQECSETLAVPYKLCKKFVDVCDNPDIMDLSWSLFRPEAEGRGRSYHMFFPTSFFGCNVPP